MVPVSDPFGAASDREIEGLQAALGPERAAAALKRGLPRLSGEIGRLKLKAIRVLRHKPGRRCVVEYDVSLKRPEQPSERMVIIGKVRAGRSGNEGYRLLNAIWKRGFDNQSADGIMVPEPLGVVSRLRMWFPARIKGESATALLPAKQGMLLARRIADAIYKLHKAAIPISKTHSLSDELRILSECLASVASARPEIAARAKLVGAGCERLPLLELCEQRLGIS